MYFSPWQAHLAKTSAYTALKLYIHTPHSVTMNKYTTNGVKRILIVRFSAMGDVAMLVPVVHALARQYPETRITVLTKQIDAPLFSFAPANVEALGIDLKQYAGIVGLEHLYGQLAKRRFDLVADMHDVLRTKYLRTRFRMARTRVEVIDKGRADKKQLIGHGQDGEWLPTSTDRYVDVLKRLGYALKLDPRDVIKPDKADFAPVNKVVGFKTPGSVWVGIAPFAAHEGKVYPIEQMRRVVELLAEKDWKVFLFGAGAKERNVLETWEEIPGVQSVCGRLGGLHNEILLMARLDVMVAMDSANMHIASLTGTTVVSVWGATHPKMGFLPKNQSRDNCVEIDDLDCRPCSVYGNKPCAYGDFRCLTRIRPEDVAERCLQVVDRARNAAHTAQS